MAANCNIVLDFITRLKDNMTPALKSAIGNVKEMANSALGTVRSAAGVFSEQLGALGGQIGKLAGMGGQLLKGLASPWTAIATAATIAVTKIYAHYKKQLDEMKAYTQKTMSEINDIFVNGAKKAAAEFSQITGENARRSQLQDMRAASRAAIDKADSAESAFIIKKSYLPKIQSAETREERAVLEAERDRAVAIDASARAEKRRDRERENAARKVEEAEAYLTNAKIQAATIHRKWSELRDQKERKQEALDEIKRQGESADKKVEEAKLALAKELHAQFQMQQRHREEQLTNQEKLNTADEKLDSAKDAQRKAVEEAVEEAVKKAREAEIKRNDERIEAQREAEERQAKDDALEQIDLMEQMLTEETRELKKEFAKRQRSRDKLAERIQQAERNILSTQEGMATDARVSGFGGGYRYQTDRNGVIDNMIDYERAQRYAQRAARDEATRQTRNDLAAAKAKQIEDDLRGPFSKSVSKADRDWLQKYKQFEDTKNIDKLKQELDQANKELGVNVKKINSNVEEIKKLQKEALTFV